MAAKFQHITLERIHNDIISLLEDLPYIDQVDGSLSQHIQRVVGSLSQIIEQVEESLSQQIEQVDDYLSLNKLLCYKLNVRLTLKKLQELQNPHSVIADMNTCTSHGFSFEKRSSLDGAWDKERYLCITDGFMIYALDLKLYKDESKGYSDMRPLPKVSTLDLLEKGLPVSMGLFKLGSDTYMISGQEFPGYQEHPGLKLPNWLYERCGFMGSSRKTYHLSFTPDDSGLSLFECNSFPLLKKAKFWPIVEKIGDQIHVIESLPSGFATPVTIPSHEVLNLNDLGRGWIKVSTKRLPEKEEQGLFIKKHLVLGDQIYATIHSHKLLLLVFNSEANKWKLRAVHRQHVPHIYGFENGRCVKQIVTSGFKDTPVYVVIGISQTWNPRKTEKPSVLRAAAHLMTAKGNVLCSLELPDFFKGVKMVHARVIEAKLFRVDEREETMCAVVLGKDEHTKREFLYVSTFTVEVEDGPPKHLPSSNLLLLGQISDEVDVETPCLPGHAFVKVAVKEWHVYDIGTDLRAGGDTDALPPRLSACFL